MNRRKTAICVLGALGLVALGALAVFLCKGRTPAAGAEDAVPHRWADSEYNAMLKARETPWSSCYNTMSTRYSYMPVLY